MGFGFVAAEVLIKLNFQFLFLALLKAYFKPIASYETLCAIPLSTCIFSLLSSTEESLHSICKQLLNERVKSSSSYFSSFISLLPDDATFLPSLWPQERHNGLLGTSLVEDAIQLRQHWLKDSQSYTVGDDELLWARATLQCRAFSFRIPPSWDLQELKKLQRLHQPETTDEEQQPSTNAGFHNAVVFMPFISIANHDDKKFCSVSLGRHI